MRWSTSAPKEREPSREYAKHHKPAPPPGARESPRDFFLGCFGYCPDASEKRRGPLPRGHRTLQTGRPAGGPREPSRIFFGAASGTVPTPLENVGARATQRQALGHATAISIPNDCEFPYNGAFFSPLRPTMPTTILSTRKRTVTTRNDSTFTVTMSPSTPELGPDPRRSQNGRKNGLRVLRFTPLRHRIRPSMPFSARYRHRRGQTYGHRVTETALRECLCSGR